MKNTILRIGTVILLCIAFLLSLSMKEPTIEEKDLIEVVPDTIDLSLLELNKDNFHFVCDWYGIAHPEVVYAQARLESGHFTSKVYKERNNFLGLYNSKKKEYYRFDHWSDCLKGYKDFVQVKWDGTNDYYTFLEKLPYAADPDYLRKVKTLVNYEKN